MIAPHLGIIRSGVWFSTKIRSTVYERVQQLVKSTLLLSDKGHIRPEGCELHIARLVTKVFLLIKKP